MHRTAGLDLGRVDLRRVSRATSSSLGVLRIDMFPQKCFCLWYLLHISRKSRAMFSTSFRRMVSAGKTAVVNTWWAVKHARCDRKILMSSWCSPRSTQEVGMTITSSGAFGVLALVSLFLCLKGFPNPIHSKPSTEYSSPCTRNCCPLYKSLSQSGDTHIPFRLVTSEGRTAPAVRVMQPPSCA